ncbi:MAG: response regulator [Candidatus Omnitrophota bacterium]
MAEKKKILVVDDEYEFVDLLKARLEASGYEVFTALDGDEGLSKFKSVKPDALLLDIMMPGTDGLEVLRRIRLEDKVVPIFIVTAFSNEERFKIATKFNASGFIIKTSDLKAEIKNIQAAIDIASKYRK